MLPQILGSMIIWQGECLPLLQLGRLGLGPRPPELGWFMFTRAFRLVTPSLANNLLDGTPGIEPGPGFCVPTPPFGVSDFRALPLRYVLHWEIGAEGGPFGAGGLGSPVIPLRIDYLGVFHWVFRWSFHDLVTHRGMSSQGSTFSRAGMGGSIHSSWRGSSLTSSARRSPQ